MRLLLENSDTHEYLTPLEEWSKNPLEGEIFSSTTVALRAASRAAIGKFSIVFLDLQARHYLKLNYS